MRGGVWPRVALAAVAIVIALFLLAPLLAVTGAPVELVGALSNVAFLTLGVAFLVLLAVAARRPRWALTLAAIGLGAEVLGGSLLLIREPDPASLQSWAWYWPVVNTAYFGGLLVAAVAVISAALGLAMNRSPTSGVALVMALAALAINRLAPYR